jgi:hypothetical protein
VDARHKAGHDAEYEVTAMLKTWLEKFNAPETHQVKPAPIDIAGMKKGGSC